MSAKKYNFVTSLENFVVEGQLGSQWTLTADLKISTSMKVASKIVTPPLRRSIGDIEANAILSGNPFLYTITDYPLDNTSPESQLQILNSRLMIALQFFNLLWLIKDNAVDFGSGFLQYPYESNVQMARVSANSWSTRYSTAKGELKVTKFSKTELQQAISMHRSLYGPKTTTDVSGSLTPSTAGTIDRIARAFFFLQGARAFQDPAQKVANYCTCFEALLSTSRFELSHQVAERVAVLIGEDTSNSLEIYRNIKKAYNTRSILVHGDELKPLEEQYVSQALYCDDYLRRALIAIFSNQEIADIIIRKSKQTIDEFFLKRLLHANLQSPNA